MSNGGSSGGLPGSVARALAVLGVVLGGVLAVLSGAYAAESVAFQSQPELTYSVEPSLQNGHRYGALSPEAQSLTREAVEAGDGTVSVDREGVPSKFEVALDEQAGAELGRTSTNVLYEGTVYRVTADPDESGGDSVVLTFSRVEGGYYEYESLSPRGRAVFTEALAAEGDSVGIYRPSPEEISPRYLTSNPGADTVYVSYRGEYYTLAVTQARAPFEGLFAAAVFGLLLGSLLFGLGLMPLLASLKTRRFAGVAGLGVFVVPQFLVHLPLLLVPAPRPTGMLWLSAVVGVVVVGAYLLVARRFGDAATGAGTDGDGDSPADADDGG